MKDYLRSTEIIDWKNPNVLRKARSFSGESDKTMIAKRCFEWVRDKIKHSYDHQMNPVTCSASEVLKFSTGYCYAKSHLLVAFLRANDIPSGFCYQRLSRDGTGTPFALHGLVAVYIPDVGWYRVDPRGHQSGMTTEFTPPLERIAFKPNLPGEYDFKEIWPDPLERVVNALRSFNTWHSLFENLPDIEILQKEQK